MKCIEEIEFMVYTGEDEIILFRNSYLDLANKWTTKLISFMFYDVEMW
jgi:hypothetical protein